MADHSLRGYLNRRSTEELNAILAYCLQEENYASYEHVILEILSVLNDRFVPDDTSKLALWVKEMLLRYKAKDELPAMEPPLL